MKQESKNPTALAVGEVRRWKNREINYSGLERRAEETRFQSSNLPSFHALPILLAFISVVGMLFGITLLAFTEEIPPINGDSPKARDEQAPHIKIEIEQRKMESAERLMKKSRLSSKISRQ